MKPALQAVILPVALIFGAAGLAAESAQPPRPVPTLGAQLVWITPGAFTMGSPATEAGHRPDETPQTEVTLTRGFWLAAIEVTHGQWKKLMGTDVLEQARRGLENDDKF